MTHSDWNEALETAAKSCETEANRWIADIESTAIALLTAARVIRALKRPAEPRQEGMVRVPREPTEEMIDRACTYWKLYPAFEGQKPQPTAGEIARFIYTAMLAAAPQSPAPEDDVRENLAALSRLRQAILDNTRGENMFWIGEILLDELKKETGFPPDTAPNHAGENAKEGK